MNTETSNKILAEFIGYKVATTQEEYDNYIESGFANVTWHISDLQFNSFLDALLPVWEKVESLGAEVSLICNMCAIDYNDEYYQETFHDTKTLAVYYGLLHFIFYYNQKQTEHLYKNAKITENNGVFTLVITGEQFNSLDLVKQAIDLIRP